MFEESVDGDDDEDIPVENSFVAQEEELRTIREKIEEELQKMELSRNAMSSSASGKAFVKPWGAYDSGDGSGIGSWESKDSLRIHGRRPSGTSGSEDDQRIVEIQKEIEKEMELASWRDKQLEAERLSKQRSMRNSHQ
jgi:hypothetical protein